MHYVFSYLKHQPFELQAFTPSVTFIENNKIYKMAFFLKNELTVKVLDKVSRIPGIGGP